MIWDRLAFSIALRNLRHQPGQTLLTVTVVATSVILIIFINALISGLQERLVSSVTGSIPHVVVAPEERLPIAVWEVSELARPDTLPIGDRVRLEQRKRTIEDWSVWLPRLSGISDRVIAVSPVVTDQALISRYEKRKAVTVTGVIPRRHNQVVDLASKLVAGRFLTLNPGEAALGYKLADDLGLQVSDKVRITGPEGETTTYTVAGIYDTGFSTVDSGTVFLTLRDGQSLFRLGRAVTRIGLKLDRIFAADDLARRLELQVPYGVESWMAENTSLLSGLKAQAQSSIMIQTFTVIAAGFGMASILIMSVVNRIREIGILRAMGTTRGQIVGVFTLQGATLGLIGALAGAAAGSGLCVWLGGLRRLASATGRTVEIFPMRLSVELVVLTVVLATGISLVASLYPAWRAARVDPIEVIRG